MDDDCDGWYEICHDDFCKQDGSACSNEVGTCIEGAYWGSCDCLSGDGTGWEGPSDTPPVPGDELYQNCVDSLIDNCGEELPDINDYCEDKEQITLCEDFTQKYYDMVNFCYGYYYEEEPGLYDIIECCEELNNYGDEFQEMIDCVMPLNPKDCDGFEDCFYGDGDTDMDTDTDGWDTGGDSDSDSDSDSDTDTDADTDTEDSDSDTGPSDGADPDGNTSSGGCSVSRPGGSGRFNLLFTVFHLLSD